MTWLNNHAFFADWSILAYLLLAIVDTHITTACVTLYLHRSQTHRSIQFHPAIAHLMRLWLWLRTGMHTKQWVAVHRCHHHHVDMEGDPHSPLLFGINRVVIGGVVLYHKAAINPVIIAQYGKGTPDDDIERLYGSNKTSLLGIVITVVTNTLLFGSWGILMSLIELPWIPFFAAGIINGLGHWWGYRNFDTPDASTNLPWPILTLLTCGEGLHNNHHHIQNSPNFAKKPGEIDLGYLYFRALQSVGLAEVTKDSGPA